MAEDERKSSTPDQSTTTWKRENALTDSSLFSPLEIILLFSRVPFAWKKIQREREGGRNSRFHETDGKLSVRLCFERVLRDCIPVNRIFPSVLVSWKSKFVWEAKQRKWDRFFFFGVENSF